MFEFILNEQMTMVIAEALSNHRYRDAAPVIAEMQRQMSKQKPHPGNGDAARQEATQ